MRKLYIPKIGDELVLAQPWTFTVYSEYRNKSLLQLMGRVLMGWETKSIGTYTFPVGTRLVVDRIYIRQGGDEYYSVTFRAKDYTTTKQTGKFKDKTVRFWAKLDDVNTMVID